MSNVSENVKWLQVFLQIAESRYIIITVQTSSSLKQLRNNIRLQTLKEVGSETSCNTPSQGMIYV